MRLFNSLTINGSIYSLLKKPLPLALPIILSNITIPLLGAVDTAVLGHLDNPEYIGAIGFGAIIFNYIFWGFGFLKMATTGLTAQAEGAFDDLELKLILFRGLLIATVIGVLLIFLQGPIIYFSLQLIDTNESTKEFIAEYVSYRIWAAPASLCLYVIMGWFFGKAKTVTVLIIQSFVNIINIILDIIFVHYLGFDIAGVAVATIIAEYSGIIISLIIVYRHIQNLPNLPHGWYRNMEQFIKLFHTNLDIFIRTVCLLTAFAWLSNKSSQLGVLFLASNIVLLQFQSIMAYGLDGFANATEIMVGKSIGGARRKDFYDAVLACTIWSALLAILFSLIFLIFGNYIILAITSIDEVIALSQEYLFWIILSPIVSVWSFLLDGIFIGAVETRVMRNMMVISLITFIVSIEVLTPLFQNHGIWLAFMILMVARALSLGLNLKGIYIKRFEKTTA